MLRISYPPMRVFVDDVRMQPKVAPVMALMAIRAKQYPPDQAWVSADEVALLPYWRNSKSRSVGTEVYNALRRLGLQQSGMVESPHLCKVTKWRLRASIEVRWHPDFDSVADALAVDTAHIVAAKNRASRTIESGVETLAAKSRVDSNGVLKKLLESHPDWGFMAQLDAIAQSDLIVQPDDRMRLSRAKSLARQAALLLQSGDSSTAAILFNTAGCIANAEKAYEDGKRWLLTAIPLLLAHGALIELEAALFNLSVNSAHRDEQGSAARIAANA